MEQRRIEIESELLPVRLERHGPVLIAVPQGDVPPLTADEVEQTRDMLRRERTTPD